jgi:hypothetical protein
MGCDVRVRSNIRGGRVGGKMSLPSAFGSSHAAEQGAGVRTGRVGAVHLNSVIPRERSKNFGQVDMAQVEIVFRSPRMRDA